MQNVYGFLKTHWDRRSPLLLAFSGGPDSLALLSAILDYQDRHGKDFDLGLAHVDHGWREQSAMEAQQLEAMAKNFSLPFHLKTLDPALIKGNLEAACRQERLKFFKELCSKFNYQAVILGHHADDQAETLLKKILEGSSVFYLSGMKPITQVHGVTLWRPMLNISKATIRQWLISRELTPIEDETNLDTRFLRGKFRTKIIPQLAEDFGKDITQTLSRIGSEASELREYFDHKILTYTTNILVNRLGAFLDLSKGGCPKSAVELKYLIRCFCERSDLSLPHHLLEKLIEFITKGVADRRLLAHKKEIFIDRQRVFVMPEKFPPLPTEAVSLELGSFTYGPWKMNVAPFSEGFSSCSSWKDLWKEGGKVLLPGKANYTLRSPSLNSPYPGSTSIRKWWTDHKVPSFLKLQVPVIYKDEKIFHEFLSGRLHPQHPKEGPWIKVTASL